MQVILKRNWFSPRGRFRFKGKGTSQEVPDSLREYLPSDAVVVEKKTEPKAEKVVDTFSEHNKLREMDIERAAGHAEDTAREQAEETKRRPGRPKKQKE